MKRLLASGVVLSLLSLLAGGRIRWSELGDLHAALREQTPVGIVQPGQFNADWLIVDGRDPEAHETRRPAGSYSVPFALRNRELYPAPDGRPVSVVVVVMERGREAQARELALWVARQWGIRRVCTYAGGWSAWVSGGEPVEEGA
jgi:rhodanese-related sulfurtransferase